MKDLINLLIISAFLFSCSGKKEVSSINPENWANRAINLDFRDSLVIGTTYLSVYSQIYGMTEHRTFDLTATVSMRNANRSDSIFIRKSEYFNTKGDLIRTYINKPIYIGPMETVEIVIDEVDKEGGTGANFIFEWAVKPKSNEPLFESVMISTSGQQGLSFTTQGIRIN